MAHAIRIGFLLVMTGASAPAAMARAVDAPEAPYTYEIESLFEQEDFSQVTPATPPATTTTTTPPASTPATPPATTTPTAPTTTPAAPPPVTPPGTNTTEEPAEDLTEPDPNAPPDGDDAPVDDLSIGEIPLIETVELTPDMAKRAIDAFVLVREKYRDAELENYENLQEFVDQNTEGKAFETDIKLFGFANVNDWNLAISTIGFAYNNAVNDQSEDIRQQIEEIKADTELAQDMKDRMIASLNAMVPSENNAKVIEELMKDPAYGERVKLLENEGE